ncbi:MAG: hypothetical protein JSV18_06835 [Candidatus Bathyarchaeota archaeon]|nr:MAG: hypothetical protein JSV18_06835 [Candidatus Bathyarchaeota archaeon]
MLRRSAWTKEETERLKLLYISGRSFEEIKRELPNRSSNAIRLKASRLGLRRPTISTPFLVTQNVLRFSDGDGNSDLLFKCSGCGSWMHVDVEDDEAEVQTIVCRQCQSICRYVA